MRIQHNIMSMNAYRNYTNNVSAMQKNLERLSSGFKINRAGDDAAGLAISEKMRAQITGLETASKNAKDGISLVQTAEGALTEVHDMLNRMVELATQSANGTYAGDTDRVQLQKEVDQLKAEIDRIADSANFNGINLLNGDMDTSIKYTNEVDVYASGALTQVSDGQLGIAPQAGVFELDLSNFEATVTGTAVVANNITISVFGQKVNIYKDGDATKSWALGDTITGEDIAKSFLVTTGTNKWNEIGAASATASGAYKKDYGFDKLEVSVDGSTVTFKMSGAPTTTWDKSSAIEFGTGVNVSYAGSSEKSAVGNQANPVQLKTITEPVDNTMSRKYAQAELDLNQIKDAIKDGGTLTIGDTTYVFAVGSSSKYKDSDNVINLTDMTADDVSAAAGLAKVAARITTAAQDNKNFKVTHVTALGGTGDSTKIYLTEIEGGVDTKDYKLQGEDNATNAQDGDWTGLVKTGDIDTAKMGKGLILQIGDTAESYNQLKVSISDCHVDTIGIGDIDISTQEGAQEAVDEIKDAINYISDVRGTLGATQNRLDHTINNLSVMTENIQDAESTIRDTDIAEEMMAYTKNNILIQAAQAMLAQANQVPQGVLQLLQ